MQAVTEGVNSHRRVEIMRYADQYGVACTGRDEIAVCINYGKFAETAGVGVTPFSR